MRPPNLATPHTRSRYKMYRLACGNFRLGASVALHLPMSNGRAGGRVRFYRLFGAQGCKVSLERSARLAQRSSSAGDP
jgi:hypothetical protein